jgi:PAS domain S-box-containing protein
MKKTSPKGSGTSEKRLEEHEPDKDARKRRGRPGDGSSHLEPPLGKEVLRSLVTSSRDLIYIVDRQGMVRYSNPRAASSLGVKPEEVVGKNIKELVSTKEIDRHADRVRSVAESRRPVRVEDEVIVGDKPVWLDTWLTPIEIDGKVDGVLGISRDVTDKKEMERKMREAAERYRSLTETSPDSVTVTDLEGNIKEINRQGVESYGAESKEDLLSSVPSAYDLVYPEDRERAAANAIKVLSGRPGRRIQYRIMRKDGSHYWAEVSASLVRGDDGEPKELLGIVRDITARRNAKIELERRNRELAAANEQLKRLHEIKDEFIATISHELRTPLVTGMGYVDLLLHGGLGPVSCRAQSRMKIALKNLKRLSSLIDDVLEYHALTDASHPDGLNHKPVDPVGLCRECVSELGDRYDRPHENAKVTTAGEVGEVCCDEQRIRQVISNLLDNGHQHGGPECRIEIRLSRQDEGVYVEVTDDGAGIDPEIEGKAFEPFVKSKLSRQGTGLGLAIVRKIIEAHGSRARLESKPGGGTTVSFLLPSG